jgi:hypothetical protein
MARQIQEPARQFRDDPVTPVLRRWVCGQEGCGGEMKSTREGFTTLHTEWRHRCDACGREEWSQISYPRIAYLPAEKIESESAHD